MGIAVWLVSALAALSAIRLAAVGLSVAAGLALAAGSPVQVAGAAVSVTAAVLLLAGYGPRRLAVPIAAAAAAGLAGTVSNAAVFLPAWVAGTLMLAAAAPRCRRGRTWASALVLCDLPVAAAGMWLAIEGPLATWLSPMPTGPAALVAVASVLRGLLPPARTGPEPAVVGVRAQALVGLALASHGALEPFFAVGGALLFGAAGIWVRGLRRDLLQEMGLLALVLTVPIGGTGALVALLGATTLLIVVRLAGPPPSSVASPAAAVARSCALGSPLWPVTAAVLMAAVRDANPAAGLVAGALIAGLWGRSLDRGPLPPAARAGPALVGTALAAGWVAPLLWGQPAWAQGVWPGPVALALVALGAAVGALGAQHPDRIRIPQAIPVPQPTAPSPGAARRMVDRAAAVRGSVAVPVALLLSAALAGFALGWVKGFL